MRDTRHTTPVVEIAGLSVAFGPTVAVRDVSFHIAPGETVCVVGESGSGKSVTSLAIMRLVEFGGGRITGGTIAFSRADGSTLALETATDDIMRGIRGNEIGMIFQEPMTSLNPVLTIGRQMTDGLRLHLGLGAAAARARALELLDRVRIPDAARRLSQFPHELSGGQRQRVVIAMALGCRPRLLICDEPTTALDVTIQAEILALIDELRREDGTAVLFITHDMAVVAQMADRVVVMAGGRLVETGPVGRVFDAPEADYTARLLAAVPRLGDMRGRPAPEPMPLPGARARARAAATPPAAASTPLLEVRHLTTRFPVRGGLPWRTRANVHAVEDVSFTLPRGQTLSLVGESGCGKSSCARSILRLTEPVGGEVILNGRDVLAMGDRDLRRVRRDMQMVFQDPFSSLNPARRLSAQVAEPLANFGIPRGPERNERVAALFDQVRLPRDFLRRFPHELSGGQRQRIAIARALALNPSLIVADEAVSALDVSVQAEVLNLMMELQGDLGLSLLFISHDMAVVERVSHSVGVMHLGRIVEIGPRAAVLEDPRHPYTRRLMAAVPVADPKRRRSGPAGAAPALRSPVYPAGHVPAPSLYDEVAPGHLVLREPL
jgi:peptide/nickel transport system ATP-binding protein/glutathione transport system ATP-binding protein